MDSRFHLKAKFTIYGKTFEWEPSLNWHADPGECDRRIVEWFVNCHAEASAEDEEKRIERERAETEERERAQLKRLREKYPDA
jgi:hypothetical protein